MFKHIKVALAVLILASCTTISVIPIGENNIGMYNNIIPVYVERSTIGSNFEELAIITAKVDAEFSAVDDREIMNKLLNKAVEIGADAVIFEEEDFHSIRVTAIRFTE